MFEVLNKWLKTIFECFTIKDPCDTCLVKACCSNECHEKHQLNCFVFPHDSLKSKKHWNYVNLGLFIYGIIAIGSGVLKLFDVI